MKKSTLAAIAAAASMIGFGAQAAGGSTGATFDVNLTLTPTCIIAAAANGTAVTTLGNIDISYSAFQTTDGTGSTSFVVRCSTSLPISSISLDNANLTDGLTGLAYKLALKTSNTGDASTPVAALTTETGNAAGTQYYVQAFVPKGQAGTTVAGTDNKTRTITVSY